MSANPGAAAPLYLGLDLGSLSCDAVLVDDAGRVAASAVVPTGARHAAAMERARCEALGAAGVGPEAIAATVSTGYGRERVEGRTAAVTEITCHARGIAALLPGTDVLVDIGGQDSKAMRLGPGGRVVEFAMNDKCAAGTGRFLDAMARAMEVRVEDLGALDATATGGLTLSSMCTVFAESEVVSLIADGADVHEIVRGLHRAVAARTVALVRRVAPGEDLAALRVAMSGGVARNAGVVRALAEALGHADASAVSVPPAPDTVGALGAALIARDRCRRSP
ncbi:MAG: 2-hydroxyglutaryl-CoA dehydratase [Deltaproteobacteria bacterium]|nr:2-hydroxyglutaryl-CoA dehydratase [Deltaproteobacteria bacterium]